MNQPPPELNKLSGLLRWLNALRAFAISIQPLPSPTCEVFPGALGTMIYPAPQGVPDPTTTGAVVQLPWDIFQLTGVGTADTTTGIFPNYTAKVWPGTVSAILPSNTFTEFTVSSDLNFWKAGCTSDGKVITAVTIYADTSPADAQAATIDAMPGNFDIVFGVTLDGEIYRTIGPGNPNVVPQKILSVPKSSPVDGLSLYDNYYIWSVQ